MEREQATPSSSALYGEKYGERGAGGKFRKPPARKPPATPYDRPTSNQSAQRQDGGWLSKLVDPARRLIACSATRIFPSFFSKSPSTAALPPSNTDTHGTDKWGIEETPNANDDNKCDSNCGMPRSTGGAGTSKVAARLKSNSERDELGQDKIKNLGYDSELSKIEQLMEGKRFSRDEINRLTEILNSRVIDLSNVQEEEEKPSMTATEDAEGVLLACENPRKSIKEKQEDMNGATLGTSMPLLQSNMRDQVGASPVDIARAYMGSRTSEIGLGSCSIMPKDDRVLPLSDEFASNPFISSPSPKSSTCWPGAMVQDQRGYVTPESQRSRYGLHNFPRTPYSRTIHLKSMNKLTRLQVESRFQNISSTPLQQSRTPIYGQVNSRSDVLDDGYGSVGPIRRIRHRFASEARPRGSNFLYSSQNAPPPVIKTSVSKVLPATGKNLEPGGTSGTSGYQSADPLAQSSEVGAPTLNPSPSQAVKKILEHLDRNKPTPKEKAAELKLATAWRKPPPPEISDVMPSENTSLPHLGGFNTRKNTELVDRRFPTGGNDDRETLTFKVKPHERSNSEATVAVNANTNAFSSVSSDAGMIHDAKSWPSLGLQNTCDSQIKGTHEAFMGIDSRPTETNQFRPLQIYGTDVMKMVPNAAGSELLKKPPSHSSGMRPILPPISINKRDPVRTVSSDNGLGFTFPISASTGILSEPPTPSIMPSFLASEVPQQSEGPPPPSYSFGTKKSTPRLVFSFPSTSSASNHDDALDLKFNFGSDKKSRLSFSLVGKDAICY